MWDSNLICMKLITTWHLIYDLSSVGGRGSSQRGAGSSRGGGKKWINMLSPPTHKMPGSPNIKGNLCPNIVKLYHGLCGTFIRQWSCTFLIAWALELAHLSTILWYFLFERTECERSSDDNRARPMFIYYPRGGDGSKSGSTKIFEGRSGMYKKLHLIRRSTKV